MIEITNHIPDSGVNSLILALVSRRESDLPALCLSLTISMAVKLSRPMHVLLPAALVPISDNLRGSLSVASLSLSIIFLDEWKLQRLASGNLLDGKYVESVKGTWWRLTKDTPTAAIGLE